MIVGDFHQDRESEGRGRALGAPTVPSTTRTAHQPTALRAVHPRFPRWLKAVDSVERSLRRPLPILLDSSVLGVSVYGVASSTRAVAVAVACFVVLGLTFGVWKRRSPVQAQGVGWYLLRVTPAAGLACTAIGFYPGTSDRRVGLAAATALVWLATFKVAAWVTVAAARRRGLGLSPTLVIGPEQQVAEAEYRIHLYPEAGLVAAHAHVCPPNRYEPASQTLARIERLLGRHSITHVVCTGGDTTSNSVMRDVVRLAPTDVDVTVVAPVPVTGSATVRLGDLNVLCLGRPSWGSQAVKRALDVLVAAVLLVALSPLLAATALAIRWGDPGPALFCQRRTGRHNRPFTIVKFRSMVHNAEDLKPMLMDRNVADGLLFKAAGDPRVTRVGAVIRRFSIDELPQLLNVLRGEMSLVGPRPLPSDFDPDDPFARIRHSVLPGITGLWQVKGANALSYAAMIDLDCAYVASRTLSFDLRILLQTIPAVLVRRDPY
jgi:lipopolysaccharide/colanic/teichoic acid biosynthesis glycosyltransferase